MRALRIGAFVAAGLGVTLLAGGVGFGPMVRARVEREAAGRFLRVEYGSARPHFGSIELRDVRVGLQGSERFSARLDAVFFRLAFPFKLDAVDVVGGEVVATGDADAVLSAVSVWRSKRPPHADPGAGDVHTPVHLEGVAASWRADDGSPFGEARGVSVSREAELSLGAESIEVAVGPLKVAASGARVALGPDNRLQVAHVHALVLGWTPATDDATPTVALDDEAPAAPDPGASPGRVAIPVTHRASEPASSGATRAASTTSASSGSSGAAGLTATSARASAGAADGTDVTAPLLVMPDLRALRDRAVAAAVHLASKLPPGAALDVDGLSLAIGGARPLTLGPGPVRVVHAAESLDVDFRSPSASDVTASGAGAAGSAPAAPAALASAAPASSSASPAPARAPGSGPAVSPASTALSLHASIPLAGGNVTVSFAGGPLSLAAMGIRDGAAGLLETSRALLEAEGSLVLDADARQLSFDGGLHVEDLSLQNARLAREPARHLELGLRARGTLTADGHLKLAEGSAEVGAIKLRIHGDINQEAMAGRHTAANLSFNVPVAACQAMISSVPAALLPTIGSSHMSGTFGATGTVSFDTQRLDDLKLDYHVDDGCRLDAVPPDLAPDRFSHAFLHRVYGPDGEVREEETGPGTPRWADLETISPFMQVAVLTTEDGGFPHNHGFNHNAIKNAIIANLKARRFVRGASTITMQLAKNLFLTREKTLSRKLEEVILTDYLEQIFQKDQMMELYLNVIEFGPDVYGIEQAAEHYFARRPEELDLSECLFLSSIMPSPIRLGKMADRGTLSEGWSHHLQTLMRIALKAGTITPAELEVGLKEQVVFHRPGTPRPSPREPVTAARLRDPGASSDEDWDYVQ